MRFPQTELVPRQGELYSHVFENLQTGLQRDLFWAVSIEFEPLHYGQETFVCAMNCEWIRRSIRRWQELDGLHLDIDYGDGGTEFSFYMSGHHLGKHARLALKYLGQNLFHVEMTMIIDFSGYYGGDEQPSMEVTARFNVPYRGLIIVPDNLSGVSESIDDVKGAAAQFVDLTAYCEPEPYNHHGYILRPKFQSASLEGTQDSPGARQDPPIGA